MHYKYADLMAIKEEACEKGGQGEHGETKAAFIQRVIEQRVVDGSLANSGDIVCASCGL